MRRLLDSYRMTPLGGALVFILVAAVGVLLLGPRHDEAPAFIVIVVVLGIVVTSAIGPNYRRGGKSLRRRQEEFHPVRRRLGEAPGAEAELEAEAGGGAELESEAWAGERERYEGRDAAR